MKEIFISWQYKKMINGNIKESVGATSYETTINKIEEITPDSLDIALNKIKEVNNLDEKPIITFMCLITSDKKTEKPKKVMREVWVIVDYNSYSIEGVYSSESLARQVFKSYADNDYYYLEKETMWEEE